MKEKIKLLLDLVEPDLSTQPNQSFDDEGELTPEKDALEIPSVPSLNSPSDSDKFIVVTDVDILEAKNGNNDNNINNQETQVKSTYLDLKEGETQTE